MASEPEHPASNPERSPGLGRRPRAVTHSIEELMELVLDGKIRVPRFQRAIKWEPEDERKLLDSVARGYPIGTLLFWKKPGHAGPLSIGPLRVQAPQVSDALWVVDGQQRITALAAALLAPPEEARKWTVVYDLDTGEFLHPKTPGRSGRTLLPLTEVLDSQKLLQWLFERGDELSKQQRSRALELGKAIREYQVPAYQVESDDEDALRNIFKRLNSSGKSMEEHEVFDALHGDRGNVPESLRAIASEIEASGFGRPDEKILLRAAKAIQGADITKEFASIEPDLLDRTSRAAREVVVFFVRDVRIPRYELLPYKLPFATLCRFFDLHPSPSLRSRELLARWVWRGAVSGKHSGDTIATRKVLRAITEDEEGSVQRLLQGAGPAAELPWNSPFNFRHANSKLEVLALLDRAPRHVAQGHLLSLEELFDRATLEQPPFCRILSEDSEYGRTIANRMVHPPISRLREALSECTDEKILWSHAISREAAALLREGNGPAFLIERSKALKEHTRIFLQRRARYNETDRPSLSALHVSD